MVLELIRLFEEVVEKHFYLMFYDALMRLNDVVGLEALLHNSLVCHERFFIRYKDKIPAPAQDSEEI